MWRLQAILEGAAGWTPVSLVSLGICGAVKTNAQNRPWRGRGGGLRESRESCESSSHTYARSARAHTHAYAHPRARAHGVGWEKTHNTNHTNEVGIAGGVK